VNLSRRPRLAFDREANWFTNPFLLRILLPTLLFPQLTCRAWLQYRQEIACRANL